MVCWWLGAAIVCVCVCVCVCRDMMSALVVDVQGTLFVGSSDNSVYAYKGATGQLLWSYATQGSVRYSAVGVDGNLIVTSDDNNVYSLRPVL